MRFRLGSTFYYGRATDILEITIHESENIAHHKPNQCSLWIFPLRSARLFSFSDLSENGFRYIYQLLDYAIILEEVIFK